eukprot:730319-Rhodomonas_salina.4
MSLCVGHAQVRYAPMREYAQVRGCACTGGGGGARAPWYCRLGQYWVDGTESSVFVPGKHALLTVRLIIGQGGSKVKELEVSEGGRERERKRKRKRKRERERERACVRETERRATLDPNPKDPQTLIPKNPNPKDPQTLIPKTPKP